MSLLCIVSIDCKIGLRKAKSDLGFGCFVAGAFHCGPRAFSIQWVFAGDLVVVPFVSGGREGFDGRLRFCSFVVF